MNINPILTKLDELLLDVGHFHDSATTISGIRVLLLVGQRDDDEKEDPDVEDLLLDATAKIREDEFEGYTHQSQLVQNHGETVTEFRKRKDRLRHQIIRQKAGLPKIQPIKPINKDIWASTRAGTTVQCPLCGAKPGKGCRKMSGGGRYAKIIKPHIPSNGTSHGDRLVAETAAQLEKTPTLSELGARAKELAEMPALVVEPPTVDVPNWASSV